jgi:hypothetical protein
VHQVLDEIEADLAEIETAVDVRRLDIDEALGADSFGETRQQSHAKGGGLAVDAELKGHDPEWGSGSFGVNCR